MGVKSKARGLVALRPSLVLGATLRVAAGTRLARSLKFMSALSATVLAKRVFRLAPLSGSGLAHCTSLVLALAKLLVLSGTT